MDLNTLIYDWNQEVNAEEKPAHAFELNDETLRDGLQSPSVKTPTLEQKIEILHLMEGLGIHAADIGLPGAGPERLQLAVLYHALHGTTGNGKPLGGLRYGQCRLRLRLLHCHHPAQCPGHH
ncbi:MAG TPA: hypothetical protein PKV06_16420, partial [bacterium]|nr:hypothetical protein [bacterium]